MIYLTPLKWVATGHLKVRLIECDRRDTHHHGIANAPEIQKMPDGCWVQVTTDAIPNARP